MHATMSHLVSPSTLGPGGSAPETAGLPLSEGCSCGAGTRKNKQGQFLILSSLKIKDIFSPG